MYIEIDVDTLFDIEFIKRISSEYQYPRTIKEKLDNLFLKLVKLQQYDGDLIDMSQIYPSELWKDFYFKNILELNFYLETLIEMNLIANPKGIKLEKDGKFINLKITYDGLSHAIELEDIGSNSSNCFVAMSFDREDYGIYSEAIQPACFETGFIAKRIDYENYNSIQTINDAIIALIKECKFCIADFTKQRDGVYFEAGYAAGRGMDVIYTCHKNHFSNSHFDTNHFPHIIYESNSELKSALINKINARIKK